MFCFIFLSAQTSPSQSSSSEADEGPAAKLARFTNDLIAENNQRKTITTNQQKKKQIVDSNAVKQQIENDEVRAIGFDSRFLRENNKKKNDYFCTLQNDHCYPTYFDEALKEVQTNGFDADSEGSDYEIVPNENCNNKMEKGKN